MLVAARLRHVAGTRRGRRRYLDMDRLKEPETKNEAQTISVGLRADNQTVSDT